MANYELTRDGEGLEPKFITIQPGTLAGHVGADSPTASIEVFRTSLDAEWDLEAVMRNNKGEKVSMGPVATHVASGRDVEVEAESGSVYDLFVTDESEDGIRQVVGGGRYAVTDAEDYEVPSMLTLDEARFLGGCALGLSDEQAAAVTARISPMTAWGMGGRVAIVGFDLGEGTGNFDNPGIMVEHSGGVNFYHGMNAQETRAKAGI